MKQSRQLHIPNIQVLGNFNEAVSKMTKNKCYNHYIPNLIDKNSPHLVKVLNTSNNILWIGPEGGFSQKEIELAKGHNFTSCTLGNSRLRTETAGLVAITISRFINS